MLVDREGNIPDHWFLSPLSGQPPLNSIPAVSLPIGVDSPFQSSGLQSGNPLFGQSKVRGCTEIPRIACAGSWFDIKPKILHVNVITAECTQELVDLGLDRLARDTGRLSSST